MSQHYTKVIETVLGIILGIILITLVITLPVFWLWNWLMPIIFGLKELTLLQALGVSLLSSFLFKSSSSK